MSTLNKTIQGSPDRFGYEWATYSTILPESRDQLQRWMGSFPLSAMAGKRVMDVGCGMGRNPFWMAKEGASAVLAVDVDDRSLESARRNLEPLGNAQVRKCSAYELDPADLGQFDVVTCIGVLHHLADPSEALRHMWSCVAPGGKLILWCYAREGNGFFLPFIRTARWIGSRLPITLTHVLAKLLALLAWPAFRLLPWRTSYYATLKQLSFRNVESIIFDQMLPHIAHYWRRADMEQILEPLQGEVTLEFVQDNSWHARIVRPTAARQA